MTLKIIHLLTGLIGIVLFLLSGQYMLHAYGGLQGMTDAGRMLFRSAHTYFLWSALLNLVLGCYLRRQSATVVRHVQTVGSLAILAGPWLIGVAFFLEPFMSDLQRPYVVPSIALALVGGILHGLASIPWHGVRIRGAA